MAITKLVPAGAGADGDDQTSSEKPFETMGQTTGRLRPMGNRLLVHDLPVLAQDEQQNRQQQVNSLDKEERTYHSVSRYGRVVSWATPHRDGANRADSIFRLREDK